MIDRLSNIWRPQNFHLRHRLGSGEGSFEGWYFKVVDGAGNQPYALIPGVIPSGYVWTQSNQFDRPGISVTAGSTRPTEAA